MAIKFFGQFLLEKKAITADQLVQAVQYQGSTNLRFGQYAHTMGYLSESDVLRLQEEQRNADMMIGELAVNLGLLKPNQVEEILTMQKNDHLFLGDALTQMGFMTQKELEKELALFKDDQKGYARGKIAMPDGVKDPENLSDLVDITQKMFRRIAHMDVKVSDEVLVESIGNPVIKFLAISVKLSGAVNCEYILSVPHTAAVMVASSVMGEDASSEPDEILHDGVKEFCNIVCGNFTARMAQKGKTVNLSPPQDVVLSGNKKAFSFSLAFTDGEISLMLVEELS
jgi:CheY-specific phosphatase CheX